MLYSDEVVYDVTRRYFVLSAADLLLGKWPSCSVLIKTASFHIVRGLSRHTEYMLFNFSVSNSAEWRRTINISSPNYLTVIVRTSCLFHFATDRHCSKCAHFALIALGLPRATAYNHWNAWSSTVDRQSSTAYYEVQCQFIAKGHTWAVWYLVIFSLMLSK